MQATLFILLGVLLLVLGSRMLIEQAAIDVVDSYVEREADAGHPEQG